jgi:hypothetical protein
LIFLIKYWGINVPINIDDSTNPISDNTPKGLIKTINALAFAIRQLAGTSSWKIPPEQSITTLIVNGVNGAKGDKGDKGDTGSAGLNGLDGASAASTISYAQITDTKPQGVGGGNSVPATVTTRTLNTINTSAAWLSLNSNQFTLTPGTYYIEIFSEAVGTSLTRCWLHDVSNNQVALLGLSQRFASSSGGTLKVVGRVVITTSTTYEIRLYTPSGITNGLGIPCNVDGLLETYTIVNITRFD